MHQNSAGHSDWSGQPQADKSSQQFNQKDESRNGKPSNIEAAFGRNKQDIPYNLKPKRHQQDNSSNQRAAAPYQSHRKSELDFSRPAESKQEEAHSKDYEPKVTSKRSEPIFHGGKLSDNAREGDGGTESGYSTKELDFESKASQTGRQKTRGGYQNQRGIRSRGGDNYESRRGDDREAPNHYNQNHHRTYSNKYPQKPNNYPNRPNHNGNSHSNNGDHKYQRASYRQSNDRMHQQDNGRNREPQGLIDENAGRKGETRSLYESLRHTATLDEYLSGLTRDCGSESLKEKEKEEIQQEFDDKMTELEMLEGNYEDNLMENHQNLGGYIQKKKQNLKESFQVFFEIHEKSEFPCRFLRINHLRQYEAELPIYAKKQDFLRALMVNDVIIFKSNAGSGKSTQLPQYLLEVCKKRILVTEPRALAASSLADRVNQAPDGLVGSIAGPKYEIRNHTQIIYMTEHEFLKQLIKDRYNFLDMFEAFVIDEAHELKKESIAIIAILKRVIMDNPSRGIKLIVTSATLEKKLFQEYFGSMRCQTIEAITPIHEVEVFYTQYPDLEINLVENTAAHLRHIKRRNEDRTDYLSVLVFLPSVKAIKEVREFLEDDVSGGFREIHSEVRYEIEELHGALSPNEKAEVLRPKEDTGQCIRVILASKIAETAITIQGVSYVLDSGLEREYFFDEITKMNSIKETKISKSSAVQRKGRAGRTAKGYCFKMYKEEDEARFEDTKVPEILRMDIADVVLMQIELAKMFDMSDLMFFEKIGHQKLMAICNELRRIEAIKTDDNMSYLTNKGQFILRMHSAVLVSAFIYECYKRGIHDEGLVAAIALENIKGFFRDSVE